MNLAFGPAEQRASHEGRATALQPDGAYRDIELDQRTRPVRGAAEKLTSR